METLRYLGDIKAKLVTSSIVASISVVEEYTLPDRGYFRARLSLENGDFLEVAEYFVFEEGRFSTKRYRYQWMDNSQKVLRKRWDNVEHFPGLPNFPYHVHVSEENQVESSNAFSTVEIIDIIEKELRDT